MVTFISILLSITIIITIQIISNKIDSVLLNSIRTKSNIYKSLDITSTSDKSDYKKFTWIGSRYYDYDHITKEVLSFTSDTTLVIKSRHFYPNQTSFFAFRYLLKISSMETVTDCAVKNDTVIDTSILNMRFITILKQKGETLYFPEFEYVTTNKSPHNNSINADTSRGR